MNDLEDLEKLMVEVEYKIDKLVKKVTRIERKINQIDKFAKKAGALL